VHLHALNAWAQGILTLQPGASAELAGVPLAFKIHVVAGMTVFLVFPFTRLVHVCSVPLGYLVRTPRQIVRALS
jgi:nitrate reductase gamma subunit